MLRADLISAEARALLASVARVVLVGQRGSLADQLDRVPEPEGTARIIRRPAMEVAAHPAAPRCSSSSMGLAASRKMDGNM